MATADKESSRATADQVAEDKPARPDDWFLVRCSGCSDILKVPSDTDATSISCPTCDTLLQLGLKDEEEESTEPAESSDSPAQPAPSIVKFGCPGCSEPVRLAIDGTSGVVACRACGQTIEYEFGDADSGSNPVSSPPDPRGADNWDVNLPPSDFDPTSAIQLDPNRDSEMGMYRHTNEFIDESLPQETEDEDVRIKTLPGGKKVRVRRKRKKRRGGLAGRDVESNIVTWDSSSTESSRRYQDVPSGKVRIEISKKRLTSDEVAQIRVLEKEEGVAPALSKRRKRIRKADARARKINKVVMMVIGSLIICLVLALVGIAIHGGFISARDSSDMTRIQKDLKVEQEKSYQDALRQFDMEKARQVALQYVKASGLEEKLKYVRHPDIVRPMMEKFYQENSAQGLERAEITQYLKDYVNRDTGWVEISDGENDPIRIFVERIGDEYKVDWEVAVGYQEMSMPEIRAKRPTTPVKLACNLSPSKYYNYGFSDKDRYLAVGITAVGNTPGKLVGYVEKESDLGRELSAIFAVEETLGAIISFRFPENPPSDNQVIILEKLQNGFIRKYQNEEEGSN